MKIHLTLHRQFISLLATAAMLGTLTAVPASASERGGAAVADKQVAVGSKRAPDPKTGGGPATSKKDASKKDEAKERAPFTEHDQAVATIPGMAGVRFFANDVEEFSRALPTAKGPWLALSGGGDDGAFGAGLLAGWSAAGTRPDFSVVTGASTGALMAPFVFLGAKYDDAIRHNYTNTTSADVFELRSTGDGMFDTWPLKETISKQVTQELLKKIAEQHKAGRRLFVVTTNLDAGRTVVWNMGAIASQGDDNALKLFRNVLLASSSIPGIFPPVMLNVEADGRKVQEMHADGTINAPFYVAPDAMLAGQVPLPAKQLYVVANTKLAPSFDQTKRDTVSVLGRSISLAMKASLRMQITRIQDAAKAAGIPVSIASVDPGFDKTSRGPFDNAYMTALFEAGVKQGQSGEPFCTAPCQISQQANLR